MAEYVEQRMEEMMNEVEQMERVMLLTSDEVKELVRKRKQYEYKLQKRMKMKEDFVEYIQYEINLLKLLEIRRENIGYHHKVGEIEGSIKTRINKLFKILEHRNQSDVSIWLSHIQFLKSHGWEEAVSRIYLRMLQVHNDKPGLWVEAANWEFETVASAEHARKILLRGLRFLPKSWILQREYVKLELLYVEQLRKRQNVLKSTINDGDEAEDSGNEADDKVLNCSIVKLVASNAVDTVNDPKFIVSLIATVRLFDFAEDVAQELFGVLEDKFPESAITWDTIAREELKNGINECTDKYLAGLEKLPSKELFKLAFSTLTECSAVYPKSMVRITKNILRLLEAGKERGLLGAEHYKFWLQLLDEEVHAANKTEIVSDAVARYPDSVDIRTEQLISTNIKASKMSKDRSSKAMVKCFSEAVEALKEDQAGSVRIWEVMLGLVDTEDGWSMLAKENGLLERNNPKLRQLHLERASYRGLTVAREVYNVYRDQPPFTDQLHRTMLGVEREQARVDTGQLRSVLATLCTQFGDQDPLCWLEAAKLELEDGKPLEAAKILARAEASLSNELKSKFAVLRDKMGV